MSDRNWNRCKALLPPMALWHLGPRLLGLNCSEHFARSFQSTNEKYLSANKCRGGSYNTFNCEQLSSGESGPNVSRSWLESCRMSPTPQITCTVVMSTYWLVPLCSLDSASWFSPIAMVRHPLLRMTDCLPCALCSNFTVTFLHIHRPLFSLAVSSRARVKIPVREYNVPPLCVLSLPDKIVTLVRRIWWKLLYLWLDSVA